MSSSKHHLKPFGIERRKVWILGVDLITITGESNIRKALHSGQLNRLTATTTSISELPLWTRLYFPLTRFYNGAYKNWFLAFRSKDHPSYSPCRRYLDTSFENKQYDQDFVKQAADLLEKTNTDSSKKNKDINGQLAGIFTQVICRRFNNNHPIDPKIIDSASHGLTQFQQTFAPWKSIPACVHVRKVYDYAEAILRESDHLSELPSEAITDVANSIFAIEQNGPVALQVVANNLDQNVETTLAKAGITPEVPRIATQSGTLDGLLEESDPMVAGKTVVLLNLHEAGMKSGKVEWAFGDGTTERQCAAKPEILRFLHEVQDELIKRRTKRSET